MAEHARNGETVPLYQKCVFCNRKPKAGERYGTGDADWDGPGEICPECWARTFREEVI
ncbi:MAG: hypothetical protein ACYTFQ_00200 [Planctomycetota bacterium]|jgi:hypothetical protein